MRGLLAASEREQIRHVIVVLVSDDDRSVGVGLHWVNQSASSSLGK
jgi:hypothetical protein